MRLRRKRAPALQAADGDPQAKWFWEHYEDAARQILEFYDQDGISLSGKRVADVGCGDGIMDLGVAHHAQPAELVGFDVNPVDTANLLDQARRFGVAGELPTNLSFQQSEQQRLPAEDASFDHVFTWSAFEHIGDVSGVLREIARIMKPAGVLFLQLWPFYHSEQGSHLWDWFPEGFVQHRLTLEEIEAQVRAKAGEDDWWANYMLKEYRALNRITLDELGAAILSAGLHVAKIEPLTGLTRLTPDLDRYPLSVLVMNGVKLLAGKSPGR
jgi:ubiquinone/menaquinone biosynthesis C-methylase UbiE